MCGIVGIWNHESHAEPLTKGLLTSMRDTMTHRGPDGGGCWFDPNQSFALAHRRLSIVDLSDAASQPMQSSDGRYCLTFNGEIYNHQELRKELEGQGYRYRSQSDTETVLYAFSEWGPECVTRFDGMWAFAVWDAKRRKLFLSRDRIGIKPLYFTQQAGAFMFASEIKALLKHPRVIRDVDTRAMYHYLTFMTTPAPLTMFRGIYKLPAAHNLVLDDNGSFRFEKYWDAAARRTDLDMAFRASGKKDLETFCSGEIRRRLEDSIAKRMMSDVPFGVFLSGGIDSSTNVALMARMMDRPVDTFTVAFENRPDLSELPHARKIHKLYKTNHHEIQINEKDLIQFLPELIFHQDEPIADPVCIPLYYVSKLARDNGTIVVQVGEGSDELFSGYAWCQFNKRLDPWWKAFQNIPRFMRQSVAWAGSRFAQSSHRNAFLSELLSRHANNEPLFWGGAISFYEHSKGRYLDSSVCESTFEDPAWLGEFDIAQCLETPLNSSRLIDSFESRFNKTRSEGGYFERMAYIELCQRLPELLLMRVDKISMATSVEARVPFLDHGLVEFAMSIPDSLKVKNGRTKHILKKAVEDLLPEEIINRPKQGFGAPVMQWGQGELGRLMEAQIETTRLKDRGFLNYPRVREAFQDFRNGRSRVDFAAWNMFNLIQWYDHWIDPS